MCLDCDGRGTGSRVRLQNGLWGYTSCPTCDSAGYVDRTGPYRLQDGTWSDGVDRCKRIDHRETSSRYEVTANDGHFLVWHESFGREKQFPTHAEAIAYADMLARNQDTSQHWHVFPLEDQIGHDTESNGECVCGPTSELVEIVGGNRWVHTHHSLDGRERSE